MAEAGLRGGLHAGYPQQKAGYPELPGSKRFDPRIELLCHVRQSSSIAESNCFDSEINWLDSGIELL